MLFTAEGNGALWVDTTGDFSPELFRTALGDQTDQTLVSLFLLS